MSSKAIFNVWDAIKQFPRLIFMTIIMLFIVFSFGASVSLEYQGNIARSYSFHSRMLVTDMFRADQFPQPQGSIYYDYFSEERLNDMIHHQTESQDQIIQRDYTRIPYAARLILRPEGEFEEKEIYFQKALFDTLKEQYVFQKAPSIVYTRSENRVLIIDSSMNQEYGFLTIEVYAI